MDGSVHIAVMISLWAISGVMFVLPKGSCLTVCELDNYKCIVNLEASQLIYKLLNYIWQNCSPYSCVDVSKPLVKVCLRSLVNIKQSIDI